MNQSYSEILDIAKRLGALQFGQFTLSSGAESKYYFDGRLLTLHPEGASLIAHAFMPILIECKAEAIAGPTLGADPIVAAVAVTSHLIGKPVQGLIVRKQAKNYGGGKVIEGPLVKGSRIAVVDDACTSGSSLLHSIQMIENAGCTVVKVLCVLDRLEGGITEIKSRGYDFASLLEYDGKGEIVPSSKQESR